MKKIITFIFLAFFSAACFHQEEFVEIQRTIPSAVESVQQEGVDGMDLGLEEEGESESALDNGEEDTTSESDAGEVAIPPKTKEESPEADDNTETFSAKKKLDISVPFTPQAPYAVWDDLHNEACEEASMIMAVKHFAGEGLDKTSAESAILALVEWQNNNGYTQDITADEVVEIMADYFSASAVTDLNVTVENIIYHLNNGSLVIIPAAGRMLGNPYYKSPGPLYHMLVIRGYNIDRREFITNDPGTRRGEAYAYSFDTLISAIHDWPKKGFGKDDVSEDMMRSGRKVMIVVSR